MTNLRTQIHYYRFNITIEEQSEAYDKLVASMKTQGIKCFETHGNGSHYDHDLGESGTIQTYEVSL